MKEMQKRGRRRQKTARKDDGKRKDEQTEEGEDQVQDEEEEDRSMKGTNEEARREHEGKKDLTGSTREEVGTRGLGRLKPNGRVADQSE